MDRLQHNSYVIRRKVFKLFGGAFHVYDPQGKVVFYSKLKAFKLKEDIRLYTGEDMQTEVLVIKARKVLDFSSAYDVVDAATGEAVGTLKRKGLKSMLKDEWIIMEPGDREIGLIQEDHLALALLRRFVISLIPQSFTLTVQGRPAATLRQHFNPFILRITADFSPDTAGALDKRLGLAAAILMTAIEGRQD